MKHILKQSDKNHNITLIVLNIIYLIYAFKIFEISNNRSSGYCPLKIFWHLFIAQSRSSPSNICFVDSHLTYNQYLRSGIMIPLSSKSFQRLNSYSYIYEVDAHDDQVVLHRSRYSVDENKYERLPQSPLKIRKNTKSD